MYEQQIPINTLLVPISTSMYEQQISSTPQMEHKTNKSANEVLIRSQETIFKQHGC